MSLRTRTCCTRFAMSEGHEHSFNCFRHGQQHFGDRQLPAELAAKLLEEQNARAAVQAQRFCAKCGAGSGDDWSQCKGLCPMPESPHYQAVVPPAPEVREVLSLLMEECAETIQRCTKIDRFGFRINPYDGKDNTDRLESELGDVRAASIALELLGKISELRIAKHCAAKLRAYLVTDGRLSEPTRLALIAAGLSEEFIEKLDYE